MSLLILQVIFYVAFAALAWQRGWIHACWDGINSGVKRGLRGPAKAPVSKLDYEKIRQLEIELGIGPQPEEDPAEGGRVRGSGYSVPACPDEEYVTPWGSRVPIRIQDPPPMIPNRHTPQIEKK